jgi:hypothetical protein
LEFKRGHRISIQKMYIYTPTRGGTYFPQIRSKDMVPDEELRPVGDVLVHVFVLCVSGTDLGLLKVEPRQEGGGRIPDNTEILPPGLMALRSWWDLNIRGVRRAPLGDGGKEGCCCSSAPSPSVATAEIFCSSSWRMIFP